MVGGEERLVGGEEAVHRNGWGEESKFGQYTVIFSNFEQDYTNQNAST